MQTAAQGWDSLYKFTNISKVPKFLSGYIVSHHIVQQELVWRLGQWLKHIEVKEFWGIGLTVVVVVI